MQPLKSSNENSGFFKFQNPVLINLSKQIEVLGKKIKNLFFTIKQSFLSILPHPPEFFKKFYSKKTGTVKQLSPEGILISSEKKLDQDIEGKEKKTTQTKPDNLSSELSNLPSHSNLSNSFAENPSKDVSKMPLTIEIQTDLSSSQESLLSKEQSKHNKASEQSEVSGASETISVSNPQVPIIQQLATNVSIIQPKSTQSEEVVLTIQEKSEKANKKAKSKLSEKQNKNQFIVNGESFDLPKDGIGASIDCIDFANLSSQDDIKAALSANLSPEVKINGQTVSKGSLSVGDPVQASSLSSKAVIKINTPGSLHIGSTVTVFQGAETGVINNMNFFKQKASDKDFVLGSSTTIVNGVVVDHHESFLSNVEVQASQKTQAQTVKKLKAKPDLHLNHHETDDSIHKGNNIYATDCPSLNKLFADHEAVLVNCPSVAFVNAQKVNAEKCGFKKLVIKEEFDLKDSTVSSMVFRGHHGEVHNSTIDKITIQKSENKVTIGNTVTVSGVNTGIVKVNNPVINTKGLKINGKLVQQGGLSTTQIILIDSKVNSIEFEEEEGLVILRGSSKMPEELLNAKIKDERNIEPD